MEFTKKTIVVRSDYYDRLKREAFYNGKQVKEILDSILQEWIRSNPESERDLSGSLEDAKATVEISKIKTAMETTGMNITKASELLGISRVYMHKLIKRHKLKFDRSKKS